MPAKIDIKFPDGTKKKYDSGMSAIEIIQKDIGEGLARAAIAAKLDDELIDLTTPITKSGTLQIFTFKDPEGKEVFWHSASHLMTQAVLRVFKGQNIGLGVGVAVEDGFYQDYGMKPLHPEDLKKIEEEMKKIVNENLDITQKDISKKEALEFYKDDPYKTDIINGLPGDTVSMYSQGEFDNLCKGPHVQNTGKLKSFKLMKIAGAYWRGDAKKEQLQRIYGIAFPDKKELKKHLEILEEAEKRDHRKIGQEMDLFSIHDAAPGMPFFHDNGMWIYNKLLDFIRPELMKRGYEENKTPIILNKDLWLQSGHWGNYKENMYFTKVDEQEYAVKPMNCPGNILIYKTKAHSYKELPIKAGEFGLVHRHELSGVLSGLFRVRVFTQDDAHVFCTEEQIEEQIIELMDLIDIVYKSFGFDYDVELSTRPEKAIGSKAVWDKSESILTKVLQKKKPGFKLNPGDGAFYGPKIDFHLKDAIGRPHQCGTVQLDFSIPEKFDLTYEGKDGKKHRPVMIHRTIYGSMERFIGILIEHYAGKFPLWLSPVQVKILTIADRHVKFAEDVIEKMTEIGIRVELDDRAETMNKKIRDAEIEKFNYILVIGDKEEKSKTVNVRTRDNKILGEKKIDKFIESLIEEIKERK